MESLIRSNKTTKCKKRIFSHPNCKTLLLAAAALIFCIIFFILSPSPTPLFQNSLPVHTLCTNIADAGETFIWYAPHSGFNNQLSELKNAILMAAILNRTLIIPPVLDHHAVALGSCPKFRVLNPNEMRFKVWNHTIQLIHELRYISMADIIDLSSLTSVSAVRFIDLRVFVSMWCGVNFDFAGTKDLNEHSSLEEKLRHCGSFLSGYDGNVNKCLYASQEDCRTTVWTYQNDDEDGILDAFQADDGFRKKKNISFLRKRKDVYMAYGLNSAVGSASILAFGSLFTAPYKGSELHIDIHKAPKDRRIHVLIQKMDFLPFVSEILTAGKKFALETIKAPFLCAQLRLLDGQFKNHWKATFLELKEEINALMRKGSLPIHVFVMTDLPQSSWSGSYLGDLKKDSNVKLFFLHEKDEFVAQTAERLVNACHSTKSEFVINKFGVRKPQCHSLSGTDILLYIQESVCSCAPLGFIGTSGSTIAESIGLMRKNRNICAA